MHAQILAPPVKKNSIVSFILYEKTSFRNQKEVFYAQLYAFPFHWLGRFFIKNF